MSEPTRHVLVVCHLRRPDLPEIAANLARRLAELGIATKVIPAEAELLGLPRDGLFIDAPVASPAAGCELVIVLGGDGTILRAAEHARGSGVPLLGVNLGHIGFLAEVEREDLAVLAGHVARRQYVVEERLTIDVAALADGEPFYRGWALNELSIEKAERERMIELAVGIDGRPLSTWGCDGVVVSTPTGSTAYAFSAGGPVVWPDVQAVLVVPLSAHALFARPLVVSPESRIAVELVPEAEGRAVMWADGRRSVDLPAGSRVEVTRSQETVHLASMSQAPFTDRLVRKFGLPVHGWRGRGRDQ